MAVKKSASKGSSKSMAKAKKETAAGKKSTASKAVKKPTKITAAKKAYTKMQIQTVIADHVGITKKQVAQVFDVLSEIVSAHLKKGAVGSFKYPDGLVKLDKQRKPAKKARKGVNPLTGEKMTFKAKPACDVVKLRSLKKLKDMV